MTFDKEEHRAILLELINTAHFPGARARDVVDLLSAIEAATMAEQKMPVMPTEL